MDSKKYKDLIIDLLKQDERLWNDTKTEFNQILLFDLIDKVDEKIINLFLVNEIIKKKFFLNINDVYIFKNNELKFFIEENKIFNSFTDFDNIIGLSDGNNFIANSNKVVLNFPFKDCVLKGGQTTEEGFDTYFEYKEEKTRTVKGEIVIEKAGFKENKEKRKEIFFNEILAQDEIDRLLDDKAFVKWKRISKDGEKTVNEIKRDAMGRIKENLIIKGNNLIAMKNLEKQFNGKVKLIYIDVPFNTGNDSFKYNDKFNHSSWLTFMKNRIEVAKLLLKDDGMIFVHCDKNEDAYLKVLMDEIFGFNNFISNIAVKSNSISGNKTRFKDKTILKNKDTILVYKKSKKIVINPQYEEKEKWDTHYNSFLEKNGKKYKIRSLKDVLIEKKIIDESDSINEDFINNKDFMRFCIQHKDQIYRLVNSIPADMKAKSLEEEDTIIEYKDTNDEIQFALNGNRIAFLSKSVKEIGGELKLAKLLGDIWSDIDFQNTQNEGGEGVSFPNGKKPERLLRRIVEMATSEGDIVLDFFMGSGTTPSVALKLNRQFIGIEQMDYIESIGVKRLKNVINGEQGGISKAINWKGGGEFVYFELAKLNEKAKEEILSCESLRDLSQMFESMCEKYFLNYNVKVDEFRNKTLTDEQFVALSLEEQKRLFIAMLDLNQIYVNKTEMEDGRYRMSIEDQKLTKMFFGEV